jgi:hypothetical protein
VKVAEVPVAGKKLWKLLVPAAVVLLAAAIGGAFYFGSRSATPTTKATPLTEKDTVNPGCFLRTTPDMRVKFSLPIRTQYPMLERVRQQNQERICLLTNCLFLSR